ncbi:DUF4221 family protein [Neolewinella lacunae]|uniref:DUF4221 family protein n=1 Tax=Neolewinella lacunae TaxID=1517758 RepID=A0A923T8T7_9BACT|nr:DUF4221 family protein [Neolewinella lacunae]MBC6995980.1 DUF4221 family protein [Neolewinella lacunae]MDN3635176.1 DUF4221 family protein [Neolewinella lacunae]
MKKVCFLITVVLFFACGSSDSAGVPSENCQIDKSDILDVPNLGFDTKYRHTQYLEVNGQALLFAYSQKFSRIDVLNLKNGEHQPSITLAQEGPEAVGDISSFHVISLDSIAILTFQDFLFVNNEGKVLDRMKINGSNADFTGLDFKKHFLYNSLMNTSPILPMAGGRWAVAVRRIDASRDMPAFYTGTKMVLLDPRTKTIQETGIEFPEEFRSANYPVTSLLACRDRDGITFAFGSAMGLYHYQEASGQISTVKLVGDTYEKGMDTFVGDVYDTKSLNSYVSENSQMVSLLFNPYLGHYYRFNYGPYPFEITGNEGKLGYLYLTILDANFRILAQECLLWDFQYYGAAPTPNGLFIYTSNDEEDLSRFTYSMVRCDFKLL